MTKEDIINAAIVTRQKHNEAIERLLDYARELTEPAELRAIAARLEPGSFDRICILEMARKLEKN